MQHMFYYIPHPLKKRGLNFTIPPTKIKFKKKWLRGFLVITSHCIVIIKVKINLQCNTNYANDQAYLEYSIMNSCIASLNNSDCRVTLHQLLHNRTEHSNLLQIKKAYRYIIIEFIRYYLCNNNIFIYKIVCLIPNL